jgi:cobalt-zinc-cadmium efflux system outer membrane protein
MGCLLAATLGAAPAAAQGALAKLTERDAVQRALSRPEHQALAGLPEAEASARLLERRILVSPSLEWSRERFDGPGTGRREDTWLLTQPLDLSGRRGLQRDAAERRLEAAKAGGEVARADLAARVREAFFEGLHARMKLERLDAASARVQRLAEVLQRQAEAGEASGADRRRARREAESLLARRTEAALAHARALAVLRSLTGEPGADCQGDLLPEAPGSWADLEAALDRGPAFRAWTAQDAASRAEAAAGRRWAPELVLGAGVKRWQEPGLQGRGSIVSLGFAFPQGRRAQAERQRSEARAQAERAETQLAREASLHGLKARWEEAVRLREAALRLESAAAQEGARLVQSLEAAYAAGEAGLFELLETQRGVLEGDLEALALALGARKARIALDQILGKVEP